MPLDRTPTNVTLRELKSCFALWGELEWTAIPDERPGQGYEVRFFRNGGWQVVACKVYGAKPQNLRQCYLLLERLRIAEKHGVQYQGLTSSKAMATQGPQEQARAQTEDLEDAYAILGCAPDDPMDLIEEVFKRKAQYYHPDKGGDIEKMKRLNKALELIRQHRGKS